ncbi:putative permease [Archaeoglobus sulfaticallidus PM70-1]|uniref:Putative permease n=1 Tax=Archaeoglobus sulfaticallidus PM70-1 TaxID=387631 RepID=N0BB57_9EURY|nr:permease [Archaeoglobus sulfaticallidus]AGK60839.1 putative permease [Archaeoglobus sulfaticallidus PM70-1]
MEYLIENLLVAGLKALEEYVALHVLTCLVPAFLIAGALMSMMNKAVLVSYLGAATSKLRSFPLAVISSFFLAVCSCTVIPIASGIYKRTNATAPAMMILWVAPATNILAVTYTGAILGVELALARIIAAISTAFIVGIVLYYFFDRNLEIEALPTNPGRLIERKAFILFVLLIATLLLPNYLGLGKPYIFKVEVFGVLILATMLYAVKSFSMEELKYWMLETWFFVKVIIPLLLLGVFIVGVIGEILKNTDVIYVWLGGEGLRQSFLATIIGALSYFATMTEAPFVEMLMRLGMGSGAALALLLAGPGLSLPNMLAIGRLFGVRRAVIYVLTIIVLSTLAGYVYGIWEVMA